MTNGGTMPPTKTAAIGTQFPAVSAAPRAKKYAALLTGPPMSKAIIAPMSKPNTIALPVPMLLRSVLIASLSQVTGPPIT